MTFRKLELRNTFARLAVMAAVACALVPCADAQVTWSIAPYLWAGSITTRADINGFDVVDRTRSASSLVDDSDFTGMFYAEVRTPKMGVFGDISFMNLGDQESTVEVTPVGGPVVAPDIHVDTKATIIDLAGFYHIGAGGTDGLDVYAGVRIMDFDQKFDLIYPNGADDRVFQIDEQITNGIVGLRYTKTFTEKWDFAARGDVGAGDARVTWLAQATAGYWFGDSHIGSFRFGWRYSEMKFEQDASEDPDVNIDSKLEISGPILGVLFRF